MAGVSVVGVSWRILKRAADDGGVVHASGFVFQEDAERECGKLDCPAWIERCQERLVTETVFTNDHWIK